jgi:hypothetical protein
MLSALNSVMMVLFFAAAVVQFNDADPWIWVSVYGAASLCCALHLADRLPFLLAAALTCAYGAGAIVLAFQVVAISGFFDPTGQAMVGVKEAGREMIGLLVTGGWVGLLASLRRPPGATAPPSAKS